MKRAGPIIILVGLSIVAAGAIQLFLAGILSPDPNPNPVRNGQLWCLCLIVGGTFSRRNLWRGQLLT